MPLPSLSSEIKTFLWAFVSHWQSYATGGVLTGVIGLVERLREKNLSKRIYALIFVGAFSLASFFMAWRDQFERAERLESALNSKPQQPSIQVNVPPINVPPAQVIVSPPQQERVNKVDSPCLHPLRFTLKRAQSQTAAYRKDITIELQGAKQLRVYHSTAFITQGIVELPNDVGHMESSGPESFDLAFEEGKIPPRTLTIPFISESDFTIYCVDRVQKKP